MRVGKIDSVQALRGIAAISVVFFHAAFVLPDGTGGTVSQWLVPVGIGGVVLFFTISGFIMAVTTHSSVGSPADALRFSINRFSRIWPTYVVLTLVFLTVIALTGLALSDTPLTLSRLIRSLLFLPPGGLPPAYGYPSLNLGWTLNFEMYFYSIFALTLLFARWRWVAFSVWFFFSLVLVPLSLGDTIADAYAPRDLPLTYMNLATNGIVWYFVIGAVLGLAYLTPLPNVSRAFAIALTLITTSLLIWQCVSQFRIGHGINQLGLSIIPWFMSIVILGRTVDMARMAPLVWLGDISYSLYLLHPAVLLLFRYVLIEMHLPQWTGFVFVPLLSIPCAMVSHRYIETKLSGTFRSWLVTLVERFQLGLSRKSTADIE